MAGQVLHRRQVSSDSVAGAESFLPADLVARSSRRLMTAALIVAATFTVYTILYRTVWVERAHTLGMIVGVASIIVSLLVAYLARRFQNTHSRLMLVGLIYEILLCLSMSIVENFGEQQLLVAERISWTCVIIVFFPALVPAPWKWTLAGSLCAAAMYPLGWAIVVPALGEPIPSAAVMLSLMLPAFVCAILALVPARLIDKLGADVRRARRLGSYELVEKLGEGGMGEVWRAEHQLLKRPAAVKLVKLRDENATNSRGRAQKRFEREAQATASLESEHTVELYDYGIADDGTFYYVMELLRGLDLHTLVEKSGPVSPVRVVHILEQVCHSLEDAHRNQLVHRDIKPANIHIGVRGRHYDFVKVLDFGLVKERRTTAAEVGVSHANEIQGTPAFMAPEVATGDGDTDSRADIYSLGCVAYFLLTGQLVFETDNPMKMLVAHVTEKPELPSVRSGSSNIPAALDELVLACLEKDPVARPGSALEVLRRLEATGLSRRWSRDDAHKWWREHMPGFPTTV